MRSSWRYVTAVVAVMFCAGRDAAAQPPRSDEPRLSPGRLVVSVGGAWVGADALGASRASTRQAVVGTATPPAATLFDTTSTLGGAPAAELGLMMAVTRAWAVEVRGRLARPTLTTTIARDVEATGSFSASERVSEYVVDASVAYQLARPRLSARARPYLLAGAGYLRQLHEDRVLVATGTAFHAGAGVRLWLVGGTGRRRDLGMTTEFRWEWRQDGIAVEDRVRSVPTLSLRLFARI